MGVILLCLPAIDYKSSCSAAEQSDPRLASLAAKDPVAKVQVFTSLSLPFSIGWSLQSQLPNRWNVSIPFNTPDQLLNSNVQIWPE